MASPSPSRSSQASFSPRSGASPSAEVREASAEFKNEITALCEHAKYLLQVGVLVGSTKLSKKFKFSESRVAGVAGPPEVGRGELRKYLQLFVAKIKGLRKLYRSKPKGTRKRAVGDATGDQLKALFYVSDQLTAFYKEVNLGSYYGDIMDDAFDFVAGTTKTGKPVVRVVPKDGIGSTADKLDVFDRLRDPSVKIQKHLGLLLEKNISNSAIFASVAGLYRRVNANIRTDTPEIKKHFGSRSDTKWKVAGKLYELSGSEPEDKATLDKYRSHRDGAGSTGLSRLGVPAGPLTHQQMMKMVNFYRVSTKLTSVPAGPLDDETNQTEAVNIQAMLHFQKLVQEWAFAPQKALAAKEVSRAKRAAKRIA